MHTDHHDDQIAPTTIHSMNFEELERNFIWKDTSEPPMTTE